jgi:hypothetical protein
MTVERSTPDIGWAYDELYVVAYDDGPRCDRVLDTQGLYVCCMYPEHEGPCMPASRTIIRAGIRVTSIIGPVADPDLKLP